MKPKFEHVSDPKLRIIAMVWRDLYGNGACTEARSRDQPAVDGCTKLWQDLVAALCEEPIEDAGAGGSVGPRPPHPSNG